MIQLFECFIKSYVPLHMYKLKHIYFLNRSLDGTEQEHNSSVSPICLSFLISLILCTSCLSYIRYVNYVEVCHHRDTKGVEDHMFGQWECLFVGK